MKLQKKSLLLIVLLLIAALLSISIFFSTVLLASYSDLEEQYVAKDLNQAVNKLNDELFSMSSIASDWGPWDDTVDFVNGDDPNYIKSNLQPYGFDNLNLNLIVMTNTRGEIVYSGAYDLQNKVMVPVPAFFSGLVDSNDPLMNMSDPHHVTTGIVMLPANPMLVVSQPIVHSNFSGSPHGVVIMGRYLNKEEISRLAALTQPSLSFLPVSHPGLSQNLVSRIQSNRGSASGLIEQLDDDEIAGYALIPDIYGKDALVLQITETRDIYHQGINTTVQVIFIILTGGLCLGLLVIFLLDRVVLKRMRSLSDQVKTIGRSGSTRDHVVIEGDDELSGLAAEINRMLGTIELAQQKVLASEARFRELAELLPMIIFEMDINGNLKYVNKAGVEKFGITEQKINEGINIRYYLSQDNIQQMQRGLSAVMSGAKSIGEIYTLKKLDGTLMRAIVNTSLIHREGKVTGFRGIVIDITERIRLEEALTESEDYLQSLFWSIRVGIVVIDAKTHTIIDVNPAALEMMDTTKDAIISQLCHTVFCPAEIGKCPITELEQTVDNAERTLLTPDGREISIIKYVVPVILRGRQCLLETFIDNTYRKQIEQQLADSEDKYRALTENTPDILFSTDMTGIITYVSPQVNKYGFLVDEVIGKSLRTLIHPADIEQVESNLSRELEKSAQFISQFRIVDKWGSTYWLEEKSSLRLDISGKPMGIYGVLHDVSERKRVEDAIDIANKKLNLMNQITRHDILNSITGLLGCVDMAKATNSPEEKELLLNDIRDLTRVIQRHITFTREYQAVGVHLPQWQNINDILNTILQNFKKSGIIFYSEIEKMEVFADPLLEKVFYNLVENAIRYGGTLTTLMIYPHISDSGFSLVFEDNGVGVEAGQKQEIFKRGVGKNTGMGLFLTAEILAITGITIEENGIFGKGARFEIRIPNGTWRFSRD